MYYLLTQILFWMYWLIVLAAGLLLARELFRSAGWVAKITAALALIPLVLRVLLIK